VTRLFGIFTSSIRRKILSSFAIVIILVLGVAIAGFYQLDQVRRSSRQMLPTSSHIGYLQDFALSLASLDANLERFFVIGGTHFQDTIQQDLKHMTDALTSMKGSTREEMRPTLGALEKATTHLESEVLALMEMQSTDLTSTEINQRIISVYSQIDYVKRLHQGLYTATLAHLHASVLNQERIISNVIRQFLSLGVAVSLIAVIASLLVTRSIATPLAGLAKLASQIAAGDLGLVAKMERADEIGALAHAFDSMTAQLRDLIGSLEQRVADRTRKLQAAAEVSHVTTSVLDPDQLLRQVVDLARERFDLYYVGLFLLDKERRFAVLRAGAGKAGQHMLARGHQLAVGGQSMIGQCVVRDEARIALDVGAEAVRFDNPFLPETRSEMALPLRSRGRVIGAMTVQSTQPAAFDESDISVMQTMADQVAVAIDNARLFTQTQATLEEMEATQRRYLGQAWDAYTRSSPVSGYAYSKAQGDSDNTGQTEAEVSPLGAEMLAEVRQAVAGRRPLSAGDDYGAIPDQYVKESPSPALVAPIMLRGLPIGALGLKQVEGGRPWSDEEIALAATIAEQFALAADNLRLLDETQRRAARERMTRELTARMRETLDVRSVLEAAADEMYQVLGLDKLVIRLAAPEALLPGDNRQAEL
jgi:GAF domain-containing protein/HAMP domain-containing protein